MSTQLFNAESFKQEQQRLEELTKRLEVLSEENFKLYIAQVIGLAVLGYAYIWFVLSLLVALTALLVGLLLHWPFLAIKLGIPLLLIIGVILRSFWIKQHPIEGIYLNKHDYPKVFQTVEEIGKAIKAPRVDEIIIVPQLNAAVVQKPRLGLFGWPKNYLLIGMELAESFSMDQFRAVLGHEMGHLAGSHGTTTAWIYSVKNVWGQLMQNLGADENLFNLMFRKFFDWYVPYFDAYSFRLCRMQEHNADRCSVDLVGKDKAAAMLIGLSVKGAFLENKYWDDIEKLIPYQKLPPNEVYGKITDAINNGITLGDAQTWLEQSLRHETDYQDTHPCHTERLSEILGLSPEQVKEYAKENLSNILKVDRSAAEELFGDRLPLLLNQLNLQWNIRLRLRWEERHNMFLAIRDEIKPLEEKNAKGELTDEELSTLAIGVFRLTDYERAKQLFDSALARNPLDADIHYAYGQCLLIEKDPKCVSFLETAIELDGINYSYNGLQQIYSFLKSNGDDERAEKYLDQFYLAMEDMTATNAERENLGMFDNYLEANLDEEAREKMREQFSKFRQIKNVFVVRKDVKYHPEFPLYVFVLDVKLNAFKDDLEARQNVINEVIRDVEFPKKSRSYVIDVKSAPARLLESIKLLDGAELFR